MKLAVIAIVVALVLSALSWRARRAHEAVADALDGADRFVDMGVVLRVVRRDDANGRRLLPGKPKLVVLREHRRGGMLDTEAGAFVGPTRNPVVWYCAESSEEVLLHGSALPLRLCVEAAMGFGKTTLLAQYAGFRVIESTGLDAEGGVTAPTVPRLGEVKRAIMELWPKAWWSFKERDQTFSMVNGATVRLVSTHQQSEAEGSPVQGWSWQWCASEEAQDSLKVHGDIEARGRDAPGGRYKRLVTCTVKDSPAFRLWRDQLLTAQHPVTGASMWRLFRGRGTDSPFVDPDYWLQLRATMSEREYARKVEAEDIASESRIYTAWARDTNLRPIPDLGAEDVTREVLRTSGVGGNHGVLVGHDPGKLYNVSLLLKAYRLAHQKRHVWYVVDEVTTRRTTTEEHVEALLTCLRTKWRSNELDWRGKPSEQGDVALVRCDPYGDSGNDEQRPDRSVYTLFRAAGLKILAAAYAPGVDAVKPGKVPKEAAIGMVNTLLCAANGDRRLYVACDVRRQPAAPQLVAALETMERNAEGKAETERKDDADKSHWPAALRYALWSLERPKLPNPGAARTA